MIFYNCMCRTCWMFEVWCLMSHDCAVLFIFPFLTPFVLASSIGTLLNMNQSTLVLTRGAGCCWATNIFQSILPPFYPNCVGTPGTRSSCRSFQIALATTAWQHGVAGNKHWSCGEMQRSDLEVGFHWLRVILCQSRSPERCRISNNRSKMWISQLSRRFPRYTRYTGNNELEIGTQLFQCHFLT